MWLHRHISGSSRSKRTNLNGRYNTRDEIREVRLHNSRTPTAGFAVLALTWEYGNARIRIERIYVLKQRSRLVRTGCPYRIRGQRVSSMRKTNYRSGLRGFISPWAAHDGISYFVSAWLAGWLASSDSYRRATCARFTGAPEYEAGVLVNALLIAVSCIVCRDFARLRV